MKGLSLPFTGQKTEPTASAANVVQCSCDVTVSLDAGINHTRVGTTICSHQMTTSGLPTAFKFSLQLGTLQTT